MSDSKFRRSVTLLDGAKADLERIKSETGASTDNAAINDALNFRAKFIGNDIASMEDAVSLTNSISKKLSGRKTEEVFIALSVYKQLIDDISGGKSVLIVDPSNPDIQTKILIPSLD